MIFSLEKELQLQPDQQILAPKEEPQEVVEQPQVEVERVEASTHAKTSKDGRKCTREANILFHDIKENVGAPTWQHRQRRSPDQYTSYMDLMSEILETKPSTFKEAVQQLVWVDAMVEPYDSIIRNSVWEVVPSLEQK